MEPMHITYGANYHCGVYRRPYWQIDNVAEISLQT